MPPNSDIVVLLKKKRRGEELTETEIDDFVKASVAGSISEAQIGAMLMAIAIKGLSSAETASLTKSKVASGHVFKWNDVICDKHSTGGVGDKISIPLAPALAALGLKIPMLSGRGLGLTGGTLDKLESIPGYRVDFTVKELIQIIERVGVFIAASNSSICPGDRILYSIRDVTATVDSDELIVASILSKKAAAGVKNLVLDLKVGDSTQHNTVEGAFELVKKMKEIATMLEMNLTVVVTAMDDPIGSCVGNSIEIQESIEVLRGNGCDDIKELILYLGAQLLKMSGKTNSLDEGSLLIENVLNNGKALKKFEEMIVGQGVDPTVARLLCHGNYRDVLPQAKYTTDLVTQKTGFVASINGVVIAQIVRDLGGGRRVVAEPLDLTAGVELLAKTGGKVVKGEPWLKVFHNVKLEPEFVEKLQAALEISEKNPVDRKSRVLKVY